MTDKPKIYFHASPLPLEVGSVILPGNWGRIIASYTNGQIDLHSMWILFREQTFELIRRTEFPDKPSRLKSAFLFLDESKAQDFRVNNNRTRDLLYEVEIVDPSQPTHIGEMNLSELANGLQFMDAVASNARQYWQGAGIVYPELITESAIRIHKAL